MNSELCISRGSGRQVAQVGLEFAVASEIIEDTLADVNTGLIFVLRLLTSQPHRV